MSSKEGIIETQKVIVLLCGPPASGKTVLSHKLAEAIPKSVVFRFDDVFTEQRQSEQVGSVAGMKRLRSEFMNIVFCHSDVSSVKKPSMSMKNDSFGNYPTIIVEDNFYLCSMRYAWFQQAKRRGWSFCTVFLTTELSVCLDRNSRRSQPVSEDVIVTQFSKLEHPDKRNTWEHFSLVTDSPSVEDVVDLINQSRAHPFCNTIAEQREKQANQSRLETMSSLVHQVDLSFRRVVASRLRKVPDAEKQAQYRRLSGLKAKAQSFVSSTGDISNLDEQMKAFFMLEED